MHRIAGLLVLAACTGSVAPPAPPPAPLANRAAPRALDRSIRGVDLLDRTYAAVQLGDEDVDSVTVVDGYVERPAAADGSRTGWFLVRPPVYGDVDGDGVEDAVVIVVDNGGGSGKFDEARVLSLRGGDVVQIARIPGGDRASGGLHAVAVERGGVRIERNDTDGGACCPTRLLVEHWRWTGRELVLDAQRTRTVELPSDDH